MQSTMPHYPPYMGPPYQEYPPYPDPRFMGYYPPHIFPPMGYPGQPYPDGSGEYAPPGGPDQPYPQGQDDVDPSKTRLGTWLQPGYEHFGPTGMPYLPNQYMPVPMGWGAAPGMPYGDDQPPYPAGPTSGNPEGPSGGKPFGGPGKPRQGGPGKQYLAEQQYPTPQAHYGGPSGQYGGGPGPGPSLLGSYKPGVAMAGQGPMASFQQAGPPGYYRPGPHNQQYSPFNLPGIGQPPRGSGPQHYAQALDSHGYGGRGARHGTLWQPPGQTRQVWSSISLYVLLYVHSCDSKRCALAPSC